ncbi:MAG TPA: metal ABC transporter ATP-binding protein [Kiritimatiellia bacterium]|jgi:zinc transport system ATP-binding protein|nr:metal ABC transporter ATP-binding protein [Kiritimatiellia bacterium]HOM58592.1 metal ABC transporter ATP-binding protein [Kiritimatiellia bacterium]HOR97530.1 metal ABC transporter ATP-binding protein [Kiritimatiellia bacterium]HPK37155.1 metal ABC transporter ATP-binding protein [Kiritimatiellia bacterium]HPW74871.1 metal ABC transporter ATP-binding protein [Kiritimatiellia bacterium]
MTAPVIDVTDVCFGYGSEEVLHNVSFAVLANTLVAVVGPNGGGKTTLLKLLLGELVPRYGSIRVLGGAPAETRTRVGYVPQSLAFDPLVPVSAREVVLMGRVGRARFGLYGGSDRRRADDALARVGLEDFGRRAFAELSGGERQRVLIAQALAGGSELLLLDEPVANVDPEQTERLYALFQELTATVTVLMVSHNLSVVTDRATHVLCVNGTAELHAINEVASSTFAAAYGGRLTTIRHDASCHVLDASGVMHRPHHGEEG